MELRERFKTVSTAWFERYMASGTVPKCYSHAYDAVSSYSHPRLTSRLNKANKGKLQQLMDPATPINTYIQNVGFKTPYRYDRGGDPFVYVITIEPRTVNFGDGLREMIRLRRYDPATFYGEGTNSGFGRRWGSGTQGWVPKPQEEAVRSYMRSTWHEVQPVYLDRLNKKERQALSFLYLLDHNGYVEGVGGVYEQQKLERNVGWVKTGERVFFLEKQK